MNEQAIQEQYQHIVSLLEQKRLKEAQVQLEAFLWNCNDWTLRNRLEQAKVSYQYMLQYMRQGVNDPERQKLYRQLLAETLELAEQALKDIISPDEQKVITPDYIISVVAEHYHVTVADLCGNKRSSKIVMPRQIAMYLCRDIIDTSLKTIGKNLGDRDHTTVMHGIEKIENELKTNDNLKNSIDTLRKKINPQG